MLELPNLTEQEFAIIIDALDEYTRTLEGQLINADRVHQLISKLSGDN